MVLIYRLKRTLVPRRQWSNAFKILSENDFQPGIPNPAKSATKCEGNDKIMYVSDPGRTYFKKGFKKLF